MTKGSFKQSDWENPSFLEAVIEDALKALLGEPLFYGPFVRRFGLTGDEWVLDFGCGGGVCARCIAKKLSPRGRVTAVDISGYWIAKAKKRLKRYPNAECVRGDVREIALPNQAYDVVSIVHTLHDIHPTERQSIVDALAAKLKLGGGLYIYEPTRPTHGMLVDEVRQLLVHAGLSEVAAEVRPSAYIGEFRA